MNCLWTLFSLTYNKVIILQMQGLVLPIMSLKSTLKLFANPISLKINKEHIHPFCLPKNYKYFKNYCNPHKHFNTYDCILLNAFIKNISSILSMYKLPKINKKCLKKLMHSMSIFSIWLKHSSMILLERTYTL